MKKKDVISIVAFIALIALIVLTTVGLSGCSEASRVNQQMSKKADYFNCERRITVYNARTDAIILQAEGYLSLSNDETDELVVTFKTGPDTYKKNYVYLSENVLYTVEDISGIHADPYHYVWYFNTNIIPTVELIP